MRNRTTTKQMMPFEPDISGEYHSMFSKVMNVQQNHRVFIDDFMEQGPGLHEMFNTLLESGDHDFLELRISSNGGIIAELQQFHSIIENKFAGRTTTILDPKGFSCGAMIFCMGDIRIVNEHSELMFHDFATGMYGKGGDLEDHLKHSAKFLRKFFKDICGHYLTDAQWKRMLDGKEWWFDTKDMCKKGIATHVMINNTLVTAKDYLNHLKEVKRIKKNPELEPIINTAYKLVDGFELSEDEQKIYDKKTKKVEREISRIRANDAEE